MSDGEKEPTVEKSTEELLSETDDLLGGLDDDASGDGSGSSSSRGASTDTSAPTDATLDDAIAGLEAETGASTSDDTTTTNADTASEDTRRFRKYFDPGSAAVSAIVVLAGAFIGGLVPIPFVGGLAQLLGVGVATFLHGTVAEKSRYAETFVASGVVGFLFALVTTNLFLTLSGIGVPLLAISTAATIVVALLGHYFGRDLRDGLTRDIGGGGGDDDVPGW
jgi:hypothetical protein